MLFLGVFAKLWKVSISFVRLSARNNLAPIGQIMLKFDIYGSFKNLSRKLKIWLKSDKNDWHFIWRLSCALQENKMLWKKKKEKKKEKKERKKNHIWNKIFKKGAPTLV